MQNSNSCHWWEVTAFTVFKYDPLQPNNLCWWINFKATVISPMDMNHILTHTLLSIHKTRCWGQWCYRRLPLHLYLFQISGVWAHPDERVKLTEPAHMGGQLLVTVHYLQCYPFTTSFPPIRPHLNTANLGQTSFTLQQIHTKHTHSLRMLLIFIHHSALNVYEWECEQNSEATNPHIDGVMET